MNRFRIAALALASVVLIAADSATGAPPLTALFPFKRIEADPQKTYDLSEEHGPWLICAATFGGEAGERQARRLVLELRKRYKVPAFVYQRKFDYGDGVIGRGVNKYGRPKKMKFVNAPRVLETAVMVGNFNAVDDPKSQKTLEKIKYAKPESLTGVAANSTYQRLAVLREIQRRITPNKDMKSKGPMRAAFITRNPLLPEEYFSDHGPDNLIMELNRGLEYSLLDCPGEISVRVATFRGESTWNLNEIKRSKREFGRLPFISDLGQSKLAEGAAKAARLTFELREKGIEAYQFHDRHSSMVTVGSFASAGDPRADGKIEINPEVHRVIERYRANVEDLPGLPGAVKPQRLAGISFDAQPMPVKVPKESVARQISRGWSGVGR